MPSEAGSVAGPARGSARAPPAPAPVEAGTGMTHNRTICMKCFRRAVKIAKDTESLPYFECI
ncbi:hypothetical protein MCOR16_011955 [Pyricularia oryzae]|nr:hypothetical protein MCOR15_011859 [Pyricularia oryzae]KAI6505050.1 hypothetical protein MCOR16_011955 [Pyricularia oryzae]